MPRLNTLTLSIHSPSTRSHGTRLVNMPLDLTRQASILRASIRLPTPTSLTELPRTMTTRKTLQQLLRLSALSRRSSLGPRLDPDWKLEDLNAILCFSCMSFHLSDTLLMRLYTRLNTIPNE